MTPPVRAMSLRVSLTSRCQLRCTYCAPEGVSPVEGASLLSAAHIERFVRVLDASLGLTKVHLTGGEPLLRRDVLDVVRRLAALNLPDLAMTSNAQRLAPLAEPLRLAGLRRVNISLDSLDAAVYASSARGGCIDATRDGIIRARACGLQVKLNTVVMRGVNDGEVLDIARWGLRHGCIVRFLELMPIGPAADAFQQRYVSSAQVRERLEEAFELRPLPRVTGATTRQFLARDGHGNSGIVGFISADSEPFCRGCRRLRLTESGQLIGCLAMGLGPHVGAILRADDPADDHLLVDAARAASSLKRAGDAFPTRHLMIGTGG